MRLRVSIALPVVALLVFLLPGVAQAAPFGPAEEAAWAEAVAYWRATPTLCTSLSREIVPANSLGVDENGGDVEARATRPEGMPTPCGVWVEEDAERLCTLMRHEYGHLLGYGHDDPELAAMPPCEETEAYVATRQEDRREAWKLWRWARTECVAARGPYRAKCWKRLVKEAKRIRARYAPST